LGVDLEKLEATAKRLDISVEKMPHHIAVIMDGNGRWAKRQGLSRAAGHREGSRRVEELSQSCVDFGIGVLTLYSFSAENWKRPKEEVDALMYLYTEYLIRVQPKLMRDNVRLVHLGRKSQLPAEVQDALDATTEKTSGNTGMVLALALNYGGRAEIIDAVRAICGEYKSGELGLGNIDEDCISSHLYTSGLSEPDLLIRTANEKRVSNFLLWQISYSEFYVTETLWPDFKEVDLEHAILSYANRKRRFGDIDD